jgi:hypothetical protein
MLPQLDELLLDIVAGALGDDNRRASAEQTLARLEQQGWQMRPAIERIWAGERDPRALGRDLDEMEAQVVTNALDLLELSSPGNIAHLAPEAVLEEPEITAEQAQALQTLLLNLPVNVRLAVIDQDAHALRQALESLPAGQRRPIVDILLEAGLLDGEDDPANAFVDDLEPVLWAVACAAITGDADARSQAQEFLADLQDGSHLGSVVLRIWDGERDFERLTSGLPQGEAETATRAIRRILEMLDGLTGEG